MPDYVTVVKSKIDEEFEAWDKYAAGAAAGALANGMLDSEEVAQKAASVADELLEHRRYRKKKVLDSLMK